MRRRYNVMAKCPWLKFFRRTSPLIVPREGFGDLSALKRKVLTSLQNVTCSLGKTH